MVEQQVEWNGLPLDQKKALMEQERGGFLKSGIGVGDTVMRTGLEHFGATGKVRGGKILEDPETMDPFLGVLNEQELTMEQWPWSQVRKIKPEQDF